MSHELPPTAPAEEPLLQDRWFFLVFLVCSLLTTAVMYLVKYPPMVDLPQHAAQITLWKEFGNALFDIGEQQYEINWFMPYLLAYGLVIIFSFVLPVLEAIRLSVILALLSHPLSMIVLVRSVGQSHWWALLGFPLAFGASFYWGLFNYLVAIPIGVLLLAQAFTLPERPGARDLLILGGLGIAAFFGHIYIWMLGFGLLLPIVAFRTRSWKSFLITSTAIIPSAIMMAIWMPRFLSVEKRFAATGPLFDFPGLLDMLYSLVSLPALAFGDAMFLPNAVAGCLLILIFAFVRLHPRPGFAYHLPWIAYTLAHLLMPMKFRGVPLINTRFAVFVPIAFLIGWQIDPARRETVPWKRILSLFVLACLCVVTWQFHGFAGEAAGFDEAIQRMEPGKKVYGLMFQSSSQYVAEDPFLHFAAWYQAQRGGMIGYSMARGYTALVRFRHGYYFGILANAEWIPTLLEREGNGDQLTIAWDTGRKYRYFIVRSDHDRSGVLFELFKEPVKLIGQAHQWWVYERNGPDYQPDPSGIRKR